MSLGISRATSVDRLLAKGRRTAPAKASIAAPLGWLVSNMVDGAGDAARLEVEQAVDIAAQRVGEECASADQAQLLAFVEQQDHRAAEAAVLEDRPDLEQSRDPDSIVGGARARGNAVVMRAEQERLAGRRPQQCDDVSDSCAGDQPRFLEVVARELIADDRLQAHLLKLGDEPRPDHVVGGEVRGMRALVAENATQAAPWRARHRTGPARCVRAAARKSAGTWPPARRAAGRRRASASNVSRRIHVPPCPRNGASHIALRRRLR